ncbi:hypothetical protein [Streptomyces olivaceiscleroticus]|uniref:Uncharacterized protein n=1 Tax=Streptomyces olivaceiscleroticus TaxID=68245 RepID=A0ABN0ZZG8_9ACTN
MSDDRSNLALVLALVVATVAGMIAVAHPELIPALTIATAAFMAMSAYLKM